MEKLDFKKLYKEYYNPSKNKFTALNINEHQFLMVDGAGDPNNSKEYKNAIEVLYAVAYKIKFYSKKNLERDYVVPPLEGLWWAENMEYFTTKRDKSKWFWTMMIMQPQWIDNSIIEIAKEQTAKKDLASLDKIRFEKYTEGFSVQIMHIGSYDDETPILEKLHNEWMPLNGYTFNGKHHEIYLSDPRKVESSKLKTILRQPVKMF